MRVISLISFTALTFGAPEAVNAQDYGKAAEETSAVGAASTFSWVKAAQPDVAVEPRGLCMVRINADHTRAEVEVARSQAGPFQALGYAEQRCAVGPRLSHQVASLCIVAESSTARQTAEFKQRFGLEPKTLCEIGRRSLGELGIAEAKLPVAVAEMHHSRMSTPLVRTRERPTKPCT